MTKVTLTELREDLFRQADKALETGEPIIFERTDRTMAPVGAGLAFQHAQSSLMLNGRKPYGTRHDASSPDYDPEDKPFERLVCAASILDGAELVTADEHIRQHLPSAIG